MILLKTTDILRFKLADVVTSNELDFVAGWVDITGFSPSNNSGTSSGTNYVTLIGSPTDGIRQVKFISIINNDTASANVTVEFYVDPDARQLLNWTLSQGDTLTYIDSEGWKVYDSTGKLKVTYGSGGGTGGAVVFSAGTTSNSLDTVIFSNLNRVSFGLNGSTITAKHALNFSAGTTSQNISDQINYFDSNGISFGLNGSTITASHNGLTSQSNQALSGSNGSFTFQTATFGEANGLLFYTSNGSLVGSYTVPSTAGLLSNINVSAGTTSNNLSALTFNNGGNVTFGLNGSVITASVPNITNSSFSVQDSATTINPVSRIAFSTGNNITATLSTAANHATVGFSHNLAGTSTGFAGANVSMSMTHNSSGLNISASVAAQSNQSAIKGLGVSNTGQTAGNTGISTGVDWVLAGSQSITLSQSTAAGGPNTIWVQHPAWLTTAMQSNAVTLSNIRVSAGTTSNLLSALTFNDANGVSFGINASTITASHNGLTSQSNQALSGSNGSFTFQTATFGNLNGLSFYSSNGSLVGSYTVPTQSNQTVGIYASGNTTLTSSGTLDARSFSIRGLGVASIGYSNNEVLVSVPAGGGGLTNINLSAGTTSNNASNFTFADSNGVSFGLNAGTITATVKTDYLTSQSNQNLSLYALGNTTQNSSTVLNASQLSFNGLGELSVGFSNGSIQLSANIDAISAYAVSNTTQSSSGTLNVGSLSFAGAGVASVGISNGSVVVSVPSGGGGLTNVNISAGTTSQNLSNFVFSNSNGVSFGLNGSTITADVRSVLSTYEPYPAMGLSTTIVGVPTATSAGVSVYPFVIEEYVSAGILNIPYSMAFLTVGTSSGRQTMGIAMGLYSRNVSTLSSIISTSFSLGVTGNNSSYTINQPTSTAYSAYGANADTNSAGSNISSGYTGVKLVGFPINTLLTPGNYWLAMIGTNSTSSVNVGISMSHFGAAQGTFGSALAPIGSFSSAFTAGQDPRGGRWYVGQGSWTSAGSVTMIPASMNMTSISAVGLTYPLMKFWST